MDDDVFATPLQFLKGVGPRRAADFAKAGLVTVEDLLYRFPIRYEDRSHLQPIASLKPGEAASIAGRVLSCGLHSTRRPGFKIFEALVSDDSASLRVTWLNQPFLRDVFTSGQQVVLFGVVEMRGHGGDCSSPTRSTKSSTTRMARRFTRGGSCRCTRRPAA